MGDFQLINLIDEIEDPIGADDWVEFAGVDEQRPWFQGNEVEDLIEYDTWD